VVLLPLPLRLVVAAATIEATQQEQELRTELLLLHCYHWFLPVASFSVQPSCILPNRCASFVLLQ
jgi:hypothetical protein